MTLAERAKLATAARQRRAAERASTLRALLADGMPRKRAIFHAGVSDRTAKRYLAGR